MGHKQGRVIATVGTATLLVVGLMQPTTALASQDEALSVALGDPVLTTDADGSALRFDSVLDDGAIVTALGEDSSGSSVVVETTYAPPAPDLASFSEPSEAESSDPVEGVDYIADVDGVVEEEYASTELSDAEVASFVPTLTTAATESSWALTWAAVDGASTYMAYTDAGESLLVEGEQLELVGIADAAPENVRVDALDGSGNVLNSRVVPVQLAAAAGGMTTMAHQPYTTAFTLENFLPGSYYTLGPAETAACGFLNQGGRRFGGDNRGYAAPTISWPDEPIDYRTRVWAVANWNNPAAYRLLLGKGVGPTRLYTYAQLTETRTASPNGIRVTASSSSSASAHINWEAEVGNPFCAGNAIWFELNVNIYRNGTIDVYGLHRPAPNYEMYVRWNNTGTDFWRTLLRRDSQGLHCLVPLACANGSLESHGSS